MQGQEINFHNISRFIERRSYIVSQKCPDFIFICRSEFISIVISQRMIFNNISLYICAYKQFSFNILTTVCQLFKIILPLFLYVNYCFAKVTQKQHRYVFSPSSLLIPQRAPTPGCGQGDASQNGLYRKNQIPCEDIKQHSSGDKLISLSWKSNFFSDVLRFLCFWQICWCVKALTLISALFLHTIGRH